MTSFRKKIKRIKQHKKFPVFARGAVPVVENYTAVFGKLESLLKRKSHHLISQADFDVGLLNCLRLAVSSYEQLAFVLAIQRMATGSP